MKTSIYALLSAQLLSILGSAVAAVAIPWLLLTAEVGPQKLAWVFAVQSGAAVLAALIGTPFLDRFEKRRTYIACDVLLATASFGLIALYLSHALHPATVAAILACSAIISSLSSAAGSAMIPELLAEDESANQRVNGLIGTFHNFGDLAGPLLGGVIIATLGNVTALAIDGATFVISGLLLWWFLPQRKGAALPAPASEATEEPAKAAYLAGLLAIVHDPMLRRVTLVSGVVNMVISPLLVLFLPVMVKQSGGSALGVGVLFSCFGVGAFLASLLYTWRGAKLAPLPSLAASMLLAVLSLALLPFVPQLGACGLLCVIGAAVGYTGPLEQTLMQNHSPANQIGRIMLAYSACRTVSVPVGFLVVGEVLGQGNSQAAALTLAGLLSLALLASMMPYAVPKEAMR
ncbi:MFS transporter [Parachitinimonas caeni]|uniref:MFS transporter n=1 Tax=Parachitinimonas caeni TaxID=3031301 RepID=A0ABT7DZP2_9NEIS|nr:MFS transporter [Parachitinimonas caeni]MDK2125542.1 MFS transporter [Parachitinimonas caeni]